MKILFRLLLIAILIWLFAAIPARALDPGKSFHHYVRNTWSLQQGLPSTSFVRGFAEQGGLLAYANDLAEIARLITDMADRILRGASPAQLPVQQNTRFDLLINLRTAEALGIKVPDLVRARATELIE